MFLYLLAQVAAASQTAAPPPPPSDVRKLFAVGDYPAEALRHHWQGAAVADLTIGPDGRVSACRIVQSTGHQILDDATCDVLSRRARFLPPRGENGLTREETFRTPPIDWRLE